MSSQAPNATRRFPHEHLVQANQKLRLKNLFRSNLRSKNGLGSTWMFQCQNEICQSSLEMNLVFPTTEKKNSAFAINRASGLGFQAIGGGHAAASTVSFYGR